jgi:septation ring formation regulator EzrA
MSEALMSEEQTQNLTDGRSFEERVFARFDALDARLNSMESRLDGMDGRLQVLERKAYDTKPIWEQALKEIAETRREMIRRLDRIESVALETRARLGDAEDRLDKLEPAPAK